MKDVVFTEHFLRRDMGRSRGSAIRWVVKHLRELVKLAENYPGLDLQLNPATGWRIIFTCDGQQVIFRTVLLKGMKHTVKPTMKFGRDWRRFVTTRRSK